MALAGLLVLAGYILACLANDSVAQSGVEDVTFGQIVCRELTVVNEEGCESINLRTDEYGGVVSAIGKADGAASLTNNKYVGSMAIHNKGGEYVFQASVTERG